MGSPAYRGALVQVPVVLAAWSALTIAGPTRQAGKRAGDGLACCPPVFGLKSWLGLGLVAAAR